MKTDQQLLEEAETLFESSAYEEASAIYRDLALRGINIAYVLDSLDIAWTFAHIKFLDVLEQKGMPNSRAAKMYKLRVLMRDHQHNSVIRLSTEIIEMTQQSNSPTLMPYTFRFRASIAAGDGKYMENDFKFIWQQLEGPKSRLKLLEDLLKASKPNLAGMIRRLADWATLDADMQMILHTKADLLDAFGQIIGERLPDQNKQSL